MDERELRLNSLSRYAKSSPQFILEEHSHCEVPAGCGGVVLRWRNPREGIPFSMRVHSPGDNRLYVDGTPPSSGRPVLPFGEHVLAFAVSGFDPDLAVLIFSGTGQPGSVRVHSSAGTQTAREAEVAVRSAQDGTWRYTLDEPDDDTWMRPGFDDSGWPVMRRLDPPPTDERSMERYRIDELLRTGAVGLGIHGSGTRAWIRRVFEIPAPTGTTRESR